MRAAIAGWLMLLAVTPVLAVQPAGEVILATGAGTAMAPRGVLRDLAKGSQVFPGDLIASGPNSYVDIRFADGGFVLLRPETRFRIDAYVYTAPAVARAPAVQAAAETAPPVAPVGSRALLRLLKGGLRAVSGSIGKQPADEYEMLTPQATIGIRGTDYFAVLCEADCVGDPTVAGALPAGTALQGGLLAGVYEGAIDVQAGAAPAARVNAGGYLMTLGNGAQLQLPALPRFLLVDPLPNPKTCAP